MARTTQSTWQDVLAFFESRLFRDVQMANLFPDSKTFADAIASAPFDVLCQRYEAQADEPGFSLQAFVDEYFSLPAPAEATSPVKAASVDDYIREMWDVLRREPDVPQYDSLIPLQHPYLVPGGRFREIYYWDSYFTATGLIADGHSDVVISLFENFLDIQAQVGCIPNGNRAYYHTRSQPPVLVLMFELIRDQLTDAQRQRAIAGLKAEHAFWMDGADSTSHQHPAAQRVVRLPDGSLLNRYYDTDPTPRPESYREDVHEMQGLSDEAAQQRLTDIRAACESGWDFSSRWLADPQMLSSIRTTALVPVDLNCLLYHLEVRLSELSDDARERDRYHHAAQARLRAINHYLYDAKHGFYFDYHYPSASQTPVWSLAAVVPLFTGLADQQQADAVAEHIETKFLQPGGLVTTLNTTSQQWDSPNGWAPLQWFAAKGLSRYGQASLANTIATRWVNQVNDYYTAHGVVLEKYNVCDRLARAGGGEYEVQLGFGWTNGVYRAFRQGLAAV
ncbi:trehalase family glycosidase [Alteromonas sp. CYL-A6]|uniref:trehalase family glycosidase n=1 Tax=Alteromonas nitratireducens TaxID=3390813 RepID=UPI0034C397BD